MALPRLYCESGVHRALTVGLTVVGALIRNHEVTFADLFPILLRTDASRLTPATWAYDGIRLDRFMRSDS